jgi:hypothetical protein
MRSGPRVLSLPRTARSSTFEPAASSGPAAEERDELAPFWIELHAIPHAERGPHRSISNWRRSVQRLVELFRTRQLLANAVGVREGCSPDGPLCAEHRIPSAHDPPASFCFGRGIRRDHRAGMTASSHTRSRHEHPDRRAGASRSLPSKDTGRGASPPWP